MNLPKKREGDVLGAAHVNRLSEAADRVLGHSVGGFGGGGVTGKGFSGLPPFTQIPVIIVADGFDGDTSEDLFTVAPCYYDSDDNDWKADDEGGEWALNDRFKPHGYYVGCKLTAYFHPSAEAFVPVDNCHRRQVRVKTLIYAAVDTEKDPSYGEVYVMRKNAAGDLETTTRVLTVCNRLEGMSFDPGDYAKAEYIDDEWQLYVADCPKGSSSSDSFDLVSE